MARVVALGVAALLTALPGEAQNLIDAPIRTPRTGAVEFRLGSYKPDMDNEPGLTGQPYQRTFGGESMLLFETELQYFFYQDVGTASVGFSAGYAEKYGNSRLTDGGVSPEKTALKVLPLRLRGLYRFDPPAFEWGIPLVPYGKLGLVYMPWWITKGGEFEVVDGREARGGRWGYELSGGVSFLLDVLDQRLARDFDSDLGVNHSYLFAEYTYAKVNNFGRDGLNLSDGYWMFGLALDY